MELWRETGHIALTIRKSQVPLVVLSLCVLPSVCPWSVHVFGCKPSGQLSVLSQAPATTHPHRTKPTCMAHTDDITPRLCAFLREPVPHQLSSLDCYRKYITFEQLQIQISLYSWPGLHGCQPVIQTVAAVCICFNRL